jgi:hypothetical protein
LVAGAWSDAEREKKCRRGLGGRGRAAPLVRAGFGPQTDQAARGEEIMAVTFDCPRRMG